MTVKTQESPLQSILEQVSRLSHRDLLKLMVYLAEQAQQTAPKAEAASRYQWTDIEGILDKPLTGMDAQDWVNQIRTQEWRRDIPR